MTTWALPPISDKRRKGEEEKRGRKRPLDLALKLSSYLLTYLGRYLVCRFKTKSVGSSGWSTTELKWIYTQGGGAQRSSPVTATKPPLAKHGASRIEQLVIVFFSSFSSSPYLLFPLSRFYPFFFLSIPAFDICAKTILGGTKNKNFVYWQPAVSCLFCLLGSFCFGSCVTWTGMPDKRPWKGKKIKRHPPIKVAVAI